MSGGRVKTLANALLAAFTSLAMSAQIAPAGKILYSDDFTKGLSNWSAELEKPGMVDAKAGALVIDVPAGATIWFKPQLSGPVIIQYEAIMLKAGGPHDRVSDLNCFWMATDARSPGELFATGRSGKFEDYNQLRTYYVGQGGNGNTTTRFRRYIGSTDQRPLLSEHDLRSPQFLLKGNVPQVIELVAWGSRIQYWRDGKLVFDFVDESPYTSGHFAFRTTDSHLEIRDFRVYRAVRQ